MLQQMFLVLQKQITNSIKIFKYFNKIICLFLLHFNNNFPRQYSKQALKWNHIKYKAMIAVTGGAPEANSLSGGQELKVICLLY